MHQKLEYIVRRGIFPCIQWISYVQLASGIIVDGVLMRGTIRDCKSGEEIIAKQMPTTEFLFPLLLGIGVIRMVKIGDPLIIIVATHGMSSYSPMGSHEETVALIVKFQFIITYGKYD